MSEEFRKIRWAAEDAQVCQKRILRHVSTQKLVAEEKAYIAEAQQVQIVSCALEEDESGVTLSISDGLLLAKAARNVIYEERKVLHLKAMELEIALETIREAAENARCTWIQSNQPFTSILTTLHQHKIRTNIYAGLPDPESISYLSTSLLDGLCTWPPTSPCPSIRHSSP